jgi:hypothetical protein
VYKSLKITAAVSMAGLLAACSTTGESGATARRDAPDARDNYGTPAEEMPTEAATPATTVPAALGDRYTELPGHYTNATPGGFDNSSAWARSGASPESR